MKKKKGGAMLEYMIIAPLGITFIWLIIQFTLFIMTVNQTQQAAVEASGYIADYMRGMSSTTAVPSSDPVLNQGIKDTVKRVVGVNGLEKMNSSIDGLTIQYLGNGGTCNPAGAEAICITSSNDQIIVVIKSEFDVTQNAHIFGNAATLPIHVVGTTQRELSNRYNYQ